MTTVVDLRTHRKNTPYIYVGRAGYGHAGHALANPFRLSRWLRHNVGARASCLQKCLHWLDTTPGNDQHLEDLAAEVARTGYPLACWCATWDESASRLRCATRLFWRTGLTRF